MQGQSNAIGSATCDSTVDPQRYWNNMRDPAEEQLSDCVVLSSNASLTYQNSAPHEEYGSSGWRLGESSLSGAHGQVNLNDFYQNSAPHEGIGSGGWSLGETSSSGAHNQVNQKDPMSEYARASCLLREQRYLSSGSPSLDNFNVNQHAEQATSGHLLMQSSVPQNLTNLESTGSHVDDDDDCQVIECVDAFRSGLPFQQCPGTGSSSRPFGTPSGNGGFIVEDSDERPSSSLDRRSSCKRKTLEASADQSSRSGSSSYVRHIESSSWQGMTLNHNTASSIPAQTENIPNVNLSDGSQPRLGLRVGHPRLGLRVGRPTTDVALASSSSETEETSRRNFRLRINNSHLQDCIPGVASSTQAIRGNANVTSSHRMLRLPPISNSLDSGPFTVAENSSHQRPTIATLRRNSHSRWYRASSYGIGSSSSAISGERAATHEEHNSRSIPTDISQLPTFIPASEISNSYQTTGNWGLVAGNVGVSGRVASSSAVGSSSGVNSPAPSLVPLRNSPHYPRRPSDFGRRSLIPTLGAETGNEDNSYNSLHSGPSSSPDPALPAGSSSHGHQRLHSRSAAMLLERHLGSNAGIPYSARSLAVSGEGRNRLVSEIRNVLDLMRRGEGLQVEDLMILDQSVFFGMADFHDRHRDMRLDVDNMSYEELLALEERIGNVSTGLSEETISSRLKQRKYMCNNTLEVGEATEPCCICQEEYKDGEDLGILECGHDYHTECIKQWLMHKNSCPICKTTGLNQ